MVSAAKNVPTKMRTVTSAFWVSRKCEHRQRQNISAEALVTSCRLALGHCETRLRHRSECRMRSQSRRSRLICWQDACRARWPPGVHCDTILVPSRTWDDNGYRLRRDNQPGPAGEKAKAAERCDGAEPAATLRERHRVKAAAEKEDPGSKQKIGGPISGSVQSERDERNRVEKMVEHRFVPDIEHAVGLQRGFQGMRAERAQSRPPESRARRQFEKVCSDLQLICLRKISGMTERAGWEEWPLFVPTS